MASMSSRHQKDEEKKRNDGQVQDELSRRGHMLENCLPYSDHGYVTMR
jgi:hypothetical protein